MLFSELKCQLIYGASFIESDTSLLLIRFVTFTASSPYDRCDSHSLGYFEKELRPLRHLH